MSLNLKHPGTEFSIYRRLKPVSPLVSAAAVRTVTSRQDKVAFKISNILSMFDFQIKR